MAVAGLVGLNMMSNQIRPKTDHEIEAEERARASAAASPTPAASPATAPPSSAPPGESAEVSLNDPNALVLAGQATSLGSPEAAREVVVGFAWTPEVQSDPSKVSNAVEALQKSLGGQARIKVVNVDASPGVPEGVSIGDKVIVPAQSDGAIDPGAADAVKQALAAAP
jgi:hypothetical protein